MPFPIERLKELIRLNPQTSLDRVFIYAIRSADGFVQVPAQIERLLARKQVKLILLDSIASHFRSENDYRQRARVFWSLSELIRSSGCPCIVTNQVTGIDSRLEPALGISWATVVNTRIVLERKDSQRRMRILFSSYLPLRQCGFTVTARGLVGSIACFYFYFYISQPRDPELTFSSSCSPSPL